MFLKITFVYFKHSLYTFLIISLIKGKRTVSKKLSKIKTETERENLCFTVFYLSLYLDLLLLGSVVDFWLRFIFKNQNKNQNE